MKTKRVLWMVGFVICVFSSSCSSGERYLAGLTPQSTKLIPSRTLSPSATLLPSSTITSTPTFLPTDTSTPLPTNTPTPTDTPSPAYVFPVQPPEVASYSRGHHDYPATDIFAPEGSAFVAVTNGVIDFLSTEDRWDPATDDPALRGGISLAIIGEDGVRYYGSHLSGLAEGIHVGLRVEAGMTLGYIGNSGNARFVAPHLHFGISHPTFPEDWSIRRGEVDPYPYLKAWQVGEMRTPEINP